MDAAWVGVIGALGGVTIGSVGQAIHARFAFQRDKNWDAQLHQRQRLESVYEVLEELRQSFGEGVTEASFVMRFGRKPEGNRPPRPAPTARLRMLVHVYTPWLVPHLVTVDAAVRSVGSSMAEAISAQKGDLRLDQPYIDAMYVAVKTLDAAIDVMLGEVVRSVRKLDQDMLESFGRRAPAISSGDPTTNQR